MMNSRPKKRNNAPRGPFKGLRSFVAGIFSSKRFLLILSLLAALLIWSVLVASDTALTRPKTFQNVAVSVVGEAALKSRGFIVMDDLNELVSGVRMTVEVTQANYNRVSGTSYNPHFDLTDVTGVGENTLEIAYSSQIYGPVISCEPSTITVNVERYMTRRVPVVLEMTGYAPEDVYLDSYRTDPTMLSVSGPQSLVTSVARAVAKLDLSALSIDRASDRTALDVELQDASGAVIVSDKLEITNQTVITDSVVVDTEVVPAALVPLELEGLVSGEPAAGYELVDVFVEQDALRVAAKQDILGSIEFIAIDQPLDISGATGSVSGYARLKKLTGIENTLPGEIAVTAVIAEKTIERTLRNVDIDVEGTAEGLSAKLSVRQSTVQLTGAHSFIDALEREDVRLFVDTSGLGEGKLTLPVQIRIDNAQEFTCALSVPEVTVTLTQTK
ncbi:MAG: YbbR-like domain-containing protein [Candidatus Ventricola sp.]